MAFCRAAVRAELVALLAVPHQACPTTEVDGQPLLVLREVRSLALPDGFAPFGGQINGDGAVVTWDRRNGEMLILAPDWRERRIFTSPIAARGDTLLAARILDDDRVQMATTRGLWTFDDRTGRVDVITRTDSMVVQSAHFGPNGWTLLVQLASGYLAIVRLRDGIWPIQPVPMRAPGRGDQPPFVVELDGGRIILLERRAPHQTIILDPDGRASIAPSDISTPPSNDDALVLITGAFPVRSRLLRVTADLRSDWRQLGLLDRDARVLRTLDLNAPFGILTVSEDGRSALGLRAVPERELVLYEIIAR